MPWAAALMFVAPERQEALLSPIWPSARRAEILHSSSGMPESTNWPARIFNAADASDGLSRSTWTVASI